MKVEGDIIMFNLSNVNLLYIEDDEINADLILEYLKLSEHTKFKTTHMATLDGGLDYIRDRCVQCEGNHQCGIDAILLDLVLPNSAGVATYKSVIDICPCIPIVIISGHEQMAYECVKMGAQDYLVKPHLNAGLIIRSIIYAIERRKLTLDIEESEEKFRNLVELTGAGIYEIDIIDHKFIYVNHVACKQTGYTKQELLKITSTKLLSEKSRIDWTERCKRFREGTSKIEDYAPFEYELIRKDGSYVWTLIVAEFITNGQGITTKAHIVAIDITKQKLIEEQLKKKEVIIFTQLEDKIHQWRDEITVRSTAETKQLKLMDSQIKSIGDTSDDKSEVM